MYQQFIGIGRTGKNPELRYTPNGTAVCNLSIACESSYKSGDEWKKNTFWADVVVYGARAESVSKYVAKGSLVMVKGRMNTRSWESNGTKHYKTEVIADDIKFLEKKKSEDSGASGEAITPEETTDLEPF